MIMALNQIQYVESAKGIIKKFIAQSVPDADVTLAFPDISGQGFSLARPLVFLEFERELNTDIQKGRHNGRGQQVKRKRLTYSFQVITTGSDNAVMKRDRVIQILTNKVIVEGKLLSGEGLRKAETKFLGSYRVREGVHLARMEFYCEIKFTN